MKADAAPTLTARALDARRFPVAQCDALFAAVLVDDDVDAHTALPPAIRLDYAQEQLIDCFCLCRQLWKTGFERDDLIRLTQTLWRERDLAADERRAFKHVRAKFKHFRYAHALYAADHRHPAMLDRVTITMGHLQDAFRNGRRSATRREAALLRLLLSRPVERALQREADRLRPADGASFRRLLESDYAALRALLVDQAVTGHRFHVARKVIGRQVSFWDTLRTLEPSPDRHAMSRSLSAINGLMGQLHDVLVARRAGDAGAYRARFVLPQDVRERLAELVDRPLVPG